MLGRPKKEDSREKQYRVRLNDEEDRMLTYASQATGVPKSEIFRKSLQDYCEKVKLQEIASEMDGDQVWENYCLSLQRVVECPYCNSKNRIDLKDKCTTTFEERSMGHEVIYKFEEEKIQCRKCRNIFSVSGYISEYPIGAFNAENIKIRPTTTTMIEKEPTTVCRNCGAVFSDDIKNGLCVNCREKRKAQWVSRLKAGVKIVGIIGAAVGTAYLAAKDSGDADNSITDSEHESQEDYSERKFRLLMKYPDGTVEEEEELFDSEEAAREYGNYMISCSQEGAEIMFMSNPGDYPIDEYSDPDYEIVEER